MITEQDLIQQGYSREQSARMAAILAGRPAPVPAPAPVAVAAPPARRSRKTAAPAPVPDRATVREWCRANGVPVTARGFIGRASYEAYESAHGGKGDR